MSPDPTLEAPGPEASGDGAAAPLAAADDDALVDARTRARLWWAAGAVYRRRGWIVGVTAAVAIASVVLSLQIPNRYRAETRVLLPEAGGGMVSAALSSLSPAASALLGSGSGGFTRYLAILTSPATLASVVDRFDLVEAYDLADEDHPRERAIAELAARASFDVNLDFDYLAVSVLDEDPRRAAQMANFFVERLNARNVEFQSSSAGEYRAFLEGRLDRAQADLDSAQVALQELQQRSGVVEPGAQAEALFSSLASAQAAASEAEVRYRALLAEYGPENPDVRAARAAAEAARGQVGALTGGGTAGIPALRGLPGVGREYARIRQELEIQRAIIETVRPLYEQAALQERRDADAVQVLDVAAPPTRKAEPRRSMIVVAATLSALLVALAVALALALWRARSAPVLARLRAEADGG